MSKNRIAECDLLVEDILKDIELSRIPLHQIHYKCLRLARLLDDEALFDGFRNECVGYPNGDLTPAQFGFALAIGRASDDIGKVWTLTVADLESQIQTLTSRLSQTSDPSISLSSANPNQFVMPSVGNSRERENIFLQIKQLSLALSKIKGGTYNIALGLYVKLRYGNVVANSFETYQRIVNDTLQKVCPKALEKFVTVYENLSSTSGENWANAVHSCRRILLDFADAVYPPGENLVLSNGKTVKLGKENYINRLVQFYSEAIESETTKKLVCSDIKDFGSRLESVYKATNKGTHDEITKQDALRYVMHTYMLLADLLSFSTLTHNAHLNESNGVGNG